jgi:hypothetical protein
MNNTTIVYCHGCGMKLIIELSNQISNMECVCGMNISYKHMPHGERRVKERRITVIDYDHISQIERRVKERRMTVIDYDHMLQIDRRIEDHELAA